MTLKLHCFGESGHSYKAALTLELGPLDWEPIHVDFFNGVVEALEVTPAQIAGLHAGAVD